MNDALGVIAGLHHRLFRTLQSGHFGERENHAVNDVAQRAVGHAAQHVPEAVGCLHFFFKGRQVSEHGSCDGYRVNVDELV